MANRYDSPVLKEFEGKEYETYPLTWVVEEINSSVPSIKRWEYQGIIPETLFGTHRFYTKNQIKLLLKVKKMFETLGKRPAKLQKKKQDLVGYVQRNWRK
jgi:hypothetical protein